MKRESAPFFGCPIPFPTHEWRCSVVDAADADTITVRIDRGWFDDSTMEIRLASIDTYERFSGTLADRELGRQAWQFSVTRAVSRYAILTTHMDREKYGRILGEIRYLGEDGALHDLSSELRLAGFEKPITK